MIIYNTYPPQPYGNLKTLCEDKDFNYNRYKTKHFPFFIGEVEVFKIPVKRGLRKKSKFAKNYDRKKTKSL